MSSSHTEHLAFRAGAADSLRLNQLAAAATAQGRPFTSRSAIIRAALALAAADLPTFANYI